MALPKGKEPTPSVALLVRHFAEALKGKTAPMLKSVEWVANNFGRPIEQIPADEPPCLFAVALLAQCEQPGGWEFFLKEFAAKLLPTKSQLEVEQRMKDDGRILSMLGRAQEEFDAQSAQRLSGEHTLPQNGDRPGELQQVSA